MAALEANIIIFRGLTCAVLKGLINGMIVQYIFTSFFIFFNLEVARQKI